MEFVLAPPAGVPVLIKPCVLPILPIIPASSLHSDLRATQVLAAEFNLSFIAFGMGMAAIGSGFGIYPEGLTRFAALVMVGFGIVMVLPALGRRFVSASAG